METIGGRKIRSYLRTSDAPALVTNTEIRQDEGHRVENFLELAKKIAALQFSNPQYVFLFRGQSNDYKNQKGNSSLKPSLFRPAKGTSDLPNPERLTQRFWSLADAEKQLVDCYGQISNVERNVKIKRQRILRWSILQHYEICFTPLLDVTQSLRVAVSFAAGSGGKQAFIYVLGVPNLSGSMTVSGEAGLQIVRLSGVCPPEAVRPHIQEGYLLGEYPDMPDFNQKQHYPHFEIDFGRRLIAKFSFNPQTFGADPNFPIIGKPALYPDEHDPMFRLANELRNQLGTQH